MMQHRRRQAIFQAAKRAFQAPAKPADGKTARTKTACGLKQFYFKFITTQKAV